MELAPAAIGAQQAILKQNVALSLIKQNNQAQQAIVGILQDSAQNVAALSRGGNVNISA
jgi:hypothetical protein